MIYEVLAMVAGTGQVAALEAAIGVVADRHVVHEGKYGLAFLCEERREARRLHNAISRQTAVPIEGLSDVLEAEDL